MNKKLIIIALFTGLFYEGCVYAQSSAEPKLAPASVNQTSNTPVKVVKPVLAPLQAPATSDKKEKPANTQAKAAPQLAIGANRDGIIEQQKK